MSAIFLMETRADQFFRGAGLLLIGILIGPWMASFAVGLSVRVNSWTWGGLAGWQQTMILVSRHVFMIVFASLAAYGAALLSIGAAVGAGLISNPWE